VPQSAQKPVLTRVRKNLPPFTLRLSEAIVNAKTWVSTGFLRFFLVFLWKTPKKGHFYRKPCTGSGPNRWIRGSNDGLASRQPSLFHALNRSRNASGDKV
jgi:hypothetical protein